MVLKISFFHSPRNRRIVHAVLSDKLKFGRQLSKAKLLLHAIYGKLIAQLQCTFDSIITTDYMLTFKEKQTLRVFTSPGKNFKRCKAMVQFATGEQMLATILSRKICVGFIEDSSLSYPSSSTCALKLFLPTGHETYEDFAKSMDKALECEAFGFHCF